MTSKKIELTKQGVPNLDRPRNGKRKGLPRLHGVCRHQWRLVLDDFGSPCGYECDFCPAYTELT
jgi:hypothetical protein